MKFRYIGDQSRGDCLGYQFPRKIAAEVTDAKHITKLKGNPHFEEVRAGKAPTPEEREAELKAKQEAEAAERAEREAAEREKEAAELKAAEEAEQQAEQQAAAEKAAKAESGEATGDGNQGKHKVASPK